MLRFIFSIVLFPLTFISALSGAVWCHSYGVSSGVILATTTFISALIVAISERILPAYPEWNESRDDVATDMTHALISMILLPKALEILIIVGIFNLASHQIDVVFNYWPSSLPILAQLTLAMVVSQFFEYWAHRLMHTHPLLWRLHATHHSSFRLYWLNASRFHPLDTATSFSISLISLLVLGAGEQITLLVTVWIGVHGMFQHANIDVRLGPLNWIFSMAELHRWHHSRNLEEANNNYGNNILLWDIVFGTVYWPKDRRADSNIGLNDMPWFPQKYMDQLMSPFRWKK